ncbi:MAG: hypothetical protein JRE64_26530 [Deltaproteobacteria bacterium]|nr:hypothetical protein [Deltaproteobacteria bacterium]
MVKFDRQSVQDACGTGAVEMILNCQTYDESGTLFAILALRQFHNQAKFKELLTD